MCKKCAQPVNVNTFDSWHLMMDQQHFKGICSVQDIKFRAVQSMG